MADKLVFSQRDFDGDRQQVSYDAYEAADLAAVYNGMKAELDKWTCGADAGGGFFEELTVDSGVSASTPIAQSNSQAIVEYSDTVTGRSGYILRIPFPKMSKADDAQTPPRPAFVAANGVTVFNAEHTDYALLEAEFQDNVLSPAGNAIDVTRIYIEE